MWIGICRRATITTRCVEGIWRISEDRLPIVIYRGHSFLLPAEFERCVPSDIKITGTSVSTALSVDLTSIGTVLSMNISASLCLPQPVRSVHFGIESLQWRIAVKPMLCGINEMLGIGWLPHQPSHAFDDLWTAVCDRALVIVIASYILRSVWFALPETLIIPHARHEVLDAIPVSEALESQSCVSFLQHVVIVRLHAHLPDPILDIFVLFMLSKWVVGIVL